MEFTYSREQQMVKKMLKEFAEKEIKPLSARMVVNRVSMEMERERIAKLINDIKAVL